MAEQTFTDEIDNVSFFDDLIQFSPVTDTSLNHADCSDFGDMWTKNSDELQVAYPISDYNCASTLSSVLAVPYEDIVQLEWLSNFVEASFSGAGMTMNKENIPVEKVNIPVEKENIPVVKDNIPVEKENIPVKKEPLAVANYQFQTLSPVSVLESSSRSSSSSSSGRKIIPLSSTHGGPQRARTKRPRPPTFNPRTANEFLSVSTLIPVPVSMESGDLVETHNGLKLTRYEPDQKKREKPKKPEDKIGIQNQNRNHGVRKCMHCEITKTPQWRAGPMGPKTLCNACGVRYKSGRLFPEYRPAASPTFVPYLHSNSHKKVVEMRTKCMPDEDMVWLPELEPELIPNMNPSVDYM